MNVLFLLILFIIFKSSNCDSLVDYYINLITSETLRAATYTLPNDASSYRPLTQQCKKFKVFDHIIVGAGASGAIVATRLSEDLHKKVLLLEAGGYETNFTDIPVMAGVSVNLEYNWNYRSIPQNNSCLRFGNRKCLYYRGKALGGSTTINGLFYSRGNQRDYDNWRNQENPGWSFQDILPFYKKLENYKINGDATYHGYNGYMNVEYGYPHSMKTFAFLNGNKELGYIVGDYNGKSPLCVGKAQLNNIEGRRGSTGRAYLRRVWNSRKNLIISPHSYVVKILISRNNKRAFGVVYIKNNECAIAISRNEIVISAGAIGSPQLLMLSGLGPKSHLESLGIPVIQNLPVGNFLKDHLGLMGLYFDSNYSEPTDTLEKLVKDYLMAKGLLSQGAALAVGFYKTKISTIQNYPDIEIIMYRYANSINTGFPVPDESQGFMLSVILLHPKSKGNLRLKSADPFEYPLINPNFFSDVNNTDLETIYEGIQLALKLLETKAFKELGIQLTRINLPECTGLTYMSREYWYCVIKQLTAAYSHPFGTCKMGRSPLTGAVVDHKLKVHNIDNLIVADASVMPDSMSGHTSAPSMMIGEKAAHMIKLKNK